MTETLTTTTATTSRETTRALLTGGLLAGPLFVAAAGAQMLTRDGFDIRKHAISSLSLGGLGWIQIGTFIVTGLLTVGCAIGLRRVLYPGRGGTWGPLLVGAYGAGLVAAGVFVTDPADGFPPGTPDGLPDHFSWHAILHTISAMVAFLALIAASFVLGRRFAVDGRRGWAAYATCTGAVLIPLFLWPSTAGAGIRLAIGAALGWALLTAVAARFRSELR
jgi:hypothetical membrane protein